MLLPMWYWQLLNQLTSLHLGRGELLGHKSLTRWKRLLCLIAVSIEWTLLKLGRLLIYR